jgi:transcriptional regulator GlxA family with amidase domain
VVRECYADVDLSLAEVASQVGSSPRQIQRVFREEGTEDFRSYLLRVRMEKAAELLSRERNPLPIRLTARRVGYRQASGLRQAFLRFYGYNPSLIQAAPPEYLGTERFGERSHLLKTPTGAMLRSRARPQTEDGQG